MPARMARLIWLLGCISISGCAEGDSTGALKSDAVEDDAADDRQDVDDDADPSDDDGSLLDDAIDVLDDDGIDVLDDDGVSADDGTDDDATPSPDDDATPAPDDDGNPVGEPEPTSSGEPSNPTPSRPLRYLRSDTDTRLVLEIDSVPGFEPRAAAESDLVERFSALLDKPDGIEIAHDDELDAMGADHVYTFDELRALSQATFDDDAPAGTVSVHVMFLDGSYESPDGGVVLGVAWGNRSIAMFKAVVDESCSALPPLLTSLEEEACRAAEYGVWSHEMGHVIGLVNNGLEMETDHEDAEHPAHDSKSSCLMYWAYDSASFVDATIERLGAGESEIDFCEDCLADMRAARGR